MLNRIKAKAKNFIRSLITINQHDPRCSPETKIALRHLYNYYQKLAIDKVKINFNDTGLRNYSQFEEDGLLMYIFATIGTKNKTFVDIGSGDGINSNCANLAINFGWNGLFIDGDEQNVKRGIQFYNSHPDTWAYPPKLLNAFIKAENINTLIKDAGFIGEIDLVSIDIDGNDYYIWKALEIVQPRVVIIETHIEFGFNSIVVPYDPDYHYPGKHPDYYGASPVAMAKQAKQKGYRLVGANLYGFNTIYIRNGISEDIIPEVSVEEILQHPRNKERFKLFEPIKDWEYIQV